jgi:hypothetical protein
MREHEAAVEFDVGGEPGQGSWTGAVRCILGLDGARLVAEPGPEHGSEGVEAPLRHGEVADVVR